MAKNKDKTAPVSPPETIPSEIETAPETTVTFSETMPEAPAKIAPGPKLKRRAGWSWYQALEGITGISTERGIYPVVAGGLIELPNGEVPDMLNILYFTIEDKK
jgi:hypothetical protein